MLDGIIFDERIYKFFLLFPQDKDSIFLTLRISPPQYIYQEIFGRSGGGAFYSDPHPINDGTVGGILNDIRFKLANLETLNKIIDRVKNDLLVMGGVTKIEQIQMKTFIEATYNSDYDIMYDSLLSVSMKNYFDEKKIKSIQKFENYYRIRFPLSPNY